MHVFKYIGLMKAKVIEFVNTFNFLDDVYSHIIRRHLNIFKIWNCYKGTIIKYVSYVCNGIEYIIYKRSVKQSNDDDMGIWAQNTTQTSHGRRTDKRPEKTAETTASVALVSGRDDTGRWWHSRACNTNQWEARIQISLR